MGKAFRPNRREVKIHAEWFNRRVARNFWGQKRFLKIRGQILNSSERLNYMQTLQRASLKNNYSKHKQF